MIEAGGDYTLAGLTSDERTSIGFSLDPAEAASAKGWKRWRSQEPDVAETPRQPITSEGEANSAAGAGLKNQLTAETFANIAKQDPILENAARINQSGNINSTVGSVKSGEAERLGRIWVGDGARLTTDQLTCTGCLVSADGLRVYRPPSDKKGLYATTGVQANLVRLDANDKVINNAHINILQ